MRQLLFDKVLFTVPVKWRPRKRVEETAGATHHDPSGRRVTSMHTRNSFWWTLSLILLLIASQSVMGRGRLELLSRNSLGRSANGVSTNSQAVITPDGRYFVFYSGATDLAGAPPIRSPNLYRVDLLTGERRLVSATPDGRPAGGSEPAITPDGRYIAFSSAATEFTALDHNSHSDIYVRDMETGTVTLVSADKRGIAGSRNSLYPVISADGRYVAFESYATTLLDVPTGGSLEISNIFWRDLQTKETRLVSISASRTSAGNGSSTSAMISADGRYVAFLSLATNLVGQSDENRDFDLFVRDMTTGVTELVSASYTGSATGDSGTSVFDMTPDARQLVFFSEAGDILPDQSCRAIYIRDRQTRTTRLVSCAETRALDLSADGRFVVQGYLFLYRTEVATGLTELVTVNRDGTGPANGHSGSASISSDGRFISFSSDASDLAEATDVDRDSRSDIFVRDMSLGVTYLASANTQLNRSGNRPSYYPVMSAAGNVVSFHSAAADLAPDDDNGVEDVFLFHVPPDGAQDLVFPRLTRSKGETTGFAVSNPGPQAVKLTLTALSPEGMPADAPGLRNPRRIELAPGQQVALLDTDVFGAGLASLAGPFWVRMEASDRVAGFYLFFNSDLGTLDGADVLVEPRTRLVLPEIRSEGFTEIHLVNPFEETAQITVELISPLGSAKGPAFHTTIAPNGSLVADLGDLFPGANPTEDDYILVTSNPALVAFEYFGEEGRFTAALNGQEGTLRDTGQSSHQMLAPQYAQGPAIQTTFTIVNLEDRDGFVDFSLHPDGLSQPPPIRRIEIPARGKLHIDDPALFGWNGTGLLTGFVEVFSPLQIVGDVAFGDRDRFASALPLVTRTPREVTFSHLASDESFFTGLAIVNWLNWAVQSEITIEVVGPDGLVLASKTETLQLGTRKSQLITDYFPELSGRALRSGYIRVHCPEGVAAFALFGTWNLSALSAIPGQIIARPLSGQ